MTRYFYVRGDAGTPARFYTVVEITTWKELLQVKRIMKSGSMNKVDNTLIHNGYILRVKDNAIEQTYILALHGFKQLQP